MIAAFLLKGRWDLPLDLGRRLADGNPVFGPHKTIRGVVVAVLFGGIGGMVMGLPPGVGPAAGGLTICGDLLSSFIKRRMFLPSGTDVPGLDQIIEGVLPLLFLGAYFDMGQLSPALLLTLFCVGARYGSILYKKILHIPTPLPNHPHLMPSRSLYRGYTSCAVRSPFCASMFNFQEAIYYHVIIQAVFKLSGLYPKGRSNALAFAIREVPIVCPNLPASFDGYRILFMTDLHLDGLNGLAERLCGLLPSIEANLCLLGGDYHMASYGSFNGARKRLEQIVPYIRTKDGIAAILGYRYDSTARGRCAW